MKECLEGLVGLSRTDCECFSSLPEAVKESSLNLFVDELEGIDLQVIENALNCGDDLGDDFETMYENAVNLFEVDLQVAISETYKQKFKPYIGKAGELKYSKVVSTSALGGIKLDTNYVDGASIVVKAINLLFNASGTVTLKVYKNDEELEDLEQEIVVASGKTTHTLPTPFNLPIVENGIQNDYFFVYETAGLQPYDNKTSCGCSGVEQLRGKFLTVRGVTGSDIDNLATNSYAYGISLDLVVSCSIDNLLCEFMVENTFMRMAGQALWYKLGVLTIESLFASRQINFDTFSDREYLYGRKSKFDKNYKNIIAWLADNTTINSSNCFVCNPINKSIVGKILL